MSHKGGAAGRHHGPGFVYVMEDRKHKLVKIGCSGEPKRREKEIQRDYPDATLINYTEASEMNGAETAAQHAVEKDFSMEKVKRNATDWYKLPDGVTSEDVFETVKRAVKNHNKKN